MDGLVGGVQFPYEMIFKEGLNIKPTVHIISVKENPAIPEKDSIVKHVFINCGTNIFTVCVYEFACGDVHVEIDMDGVKYLGINNADYREIKSDRKKRKLEINRKSVRRTDEDRRRMWG